MIDIVQEVDTTTPHEAAEVIEACAVFGYEFVLTATWQPNPPLTRRHMVYHFIVTDPDTTHVIGPHQLRDMLRDAGKPVEVLNLEDRTYRCLHRGNIQTVGELASCSEDDLLDIQDFGQRSLDDVTAKLEMLGMTLSGRPDG